jgi:hypothetical protein
MACMGQAATGNRVRIRSQMMSNAQAAPLADGDDFQRRLFAWALLSGLVLLAAMSWPFYRGLVYSSDDLWAFHLPLRHFYARCLAEGHRFDWTPLVFNGFYLAGEGQVGTYHPLHLLLYRTLSLRAAFDLELLLSYPCLLAGSFLFLRALIASRAGAMVGAVVFTFSGFNLLHFIHPNAIAIVAPIPWLLWAIQVRTTTSSPLWRATSSAVISLLTASQLLLGYPQYFWFSLLIEAGYTAYLLPAQGSAAKTMLALVAAKLLGLLMGSIQLLPTVEALSGSERSTVDAAFVHSGSLHPLNLVQLIAPYLFATRVAGQNTHELGLYIGAAPLLLAVWLVGQRANWKELRRPTLFALVVVLLAGWLALGQYGVLYRLQTLLPLVGGFRMPARYIVLVHLGFAMLSAISMAALMRQQAEGIRSPWSELGPLWRAAAASVLLAIAGPLLWPEQVASPQLVWTGPALLMTSAALVTAAARGRRWALVAVVVVTAVDLGAYGLSYAVYPNAVALDEYLEAGVSPPAERGVRIAADLPKPGQTITRAGNHLSARGWPQADGYAGLPPVRHLDYSQPANLRLAAVHWVLDHDGSAKRDGLIDRSGPWLQVVNSLPRARLVGEAIADHGPLAMAIAQIDPVRQAVVDRQIELDGKSPGKIELCLDRPGELAIDVDANGRQLLVVADSFHAGWRASVDGWPAEVLRVNGDFLGCLVDAGRHRVRLTFDPWSLRWGRWLSLAGLGLLTVGCVGQCVSGFGAARKNQVFLRQA